MTQRIKITGYVDVDSITDADLDLSHEMGVSTRGYDTGLSGLEIKHLEDVEYELVDD